MEPEPPALRLTVPPLRLTVPIIMLPPEPDVVDRPRVPPVEPEIVPGAERLPEEETSRVPVPRLAAPTLVVPPDDTSMVPEVVVAVTEVGPEVVRLSVPEPVVAVSVLALVLLLVSVALPEPVVTLKLSVVSVVPPV